ncbi:hypothetical protein BO99DRAFT_461375 [Aspergillus violaceofuscus CBS 115571]|uniref:Uncharacterized protein n=1 Tax=Aspergillus violaceofuscus (strain CBS 115571) TaxID=1450538 RepID=A0A2V5IET7_ASPV1|nr:hypothetical protein BO99DRAFT_461375 [Aspergillus violaceofuscus CBS 115571]
MAEVLLPWLNGHLDLRQAYTFTLNDIVDTLRDIVQDPVSYGVPPQNVNMLISIHGHITRLRQPTGQDYLNPPPPQSVHRDLNPQWPRSIARFRLERSTYDGLEYWALPDYLGLFLSKLERAPAGATKRNFYLPVTAVFGRWCVKLLSGRRWQKPRVYQCTWADAGEFHLGASRGGWTLESGMGSWLAVLDRARFGVVRSTVLDLAYWSQAWTPTIVSEGRRRGTPFGRCAETYPFRKLLMEKSREEAERVCGLALCNNYISEPVYDDRLSGKVWESLWDPCLNCRTLIRLHQGNVLNFLRTTGREGAPP